MDKLKCTLQGLKPGLNWCISVSIAFDYSCDVIPMIIAIAICQCIEIACPKRRSLKSWITEGICCEHPLRGQLVRQNSIWEAQCVRESLATYKWGERYGGKRADLDPQPWCCRTLEKSLYCLPTVKFHKHAIMHINAASSLHSLLSLGERPPLFSSKVLLGKLSSFKFLLEYRFIRSSLALSR